MAFLLRVELPDVPGSLGALATALGGAGADIEAIEIVERQSSGRVVDDVLLELPPRLMPDALITACHKLDGVRVHWISRYNAGAFVVVFPKASQGSGSGREKRRRESDRRVHSGQG